jgi:ATP-dependent Clp protease, protease subunit
MLPEPAPLSRMDDDEEHDKTTAPRSAIMKRLLESRTVLLCGPITDDLARDVMAQLLVLDAADSAKPIKVFINSPGGSVDAGFAIYDAMRFIQAPVHTICAGLAASAATVILLGAAKGRRWSLPNTRFLIHQPSTGMQGTASDVAIGAKEILKLREKVNRLMAAETGQSYEKIAEDTHRDYWMGAEEAIAYGLIQKIAANSGELKT